MHPDEIIHTDLTCHVCNRMMAERYQAANALNVSGRTVYRLLEQGALACKRIGRMRFIHVDEVARYAREGWQEVRFLLRWTSRNTRP